MKILLRAKDIPVGSIVSKPGEPVRYVLTDHWPAYQFGNQKRDRIEIVAGHLFLADNYEFGIGTTIPDSIEIVWHATENQVAIFLGLVRESYASDEG